MLGKDDAQVIAGALDVLAGRGLAAIHGRGDLVIGQFLDHPQRDRHRLTAAESIDGREDLAVKFPPGELIRGESAGSTGSTGRSTDSAFRSRRARRRTTS